MRSILIANADWIARERGSLRRLVTGLLAQHHRVLVLAPDTRDPIELPCDHLAYRPSNWRWLRDCRLRAMLQTLREHDPDLLHALDGSLERPVFALAKLLRTPAVCSLWSADEVDGLRGPPNHGAEGPVPVAYGAASETLAARCQRRLGEEVKVQVTTPGVYAKDADRRAPPLSDPLHSLCIAVVGDGRADAAYHAFLEGMAEVKARFGHAVYFFYTDGVEQHHVWDLATRRGLLGQVSLLRDDPENRKLLVQADVVIQPQSRGRVRTLILEALAAARPVIAAADPAYRGILHEDHALLLEQPDAATWARALIDLLERPDAMAAMGRRGAQHVRRHHTVSTQVRQTLQLYGAVVPPEAIPFEAEQMG